MPFKFNSLVLFIKIITGLIVNLYRKTILIDRFFVFRTVLAKCLKNVHQKIRFKFDSKSLASRLAAKIIRSCFLGP